MIVGAAGVGLVLTWLYVSGLCSCVCRIYTAVSQDRLPSVYRTWAARRFLQMLEPKIFAIQGTLEQPLDLETLRIGSAEAATSPALPSQPHSERRALSFHLLLTVLLANAIWSWLELRGMARHSPPLSDAFSMLEIAAAILTIVQHRRQKVSGAQQKLAIATLVGAGLFFYGTMISAAALAGAQAAAREAVNTTSIIHYSAQLDFIAALVLSLAGVAILFLDKPSKQEHGSIIS
jgi:hypothetical protein